jgi:nucleotide-binding universal stress UspA family protein
MVTTSSQHPETLLYDTIIVGVDEDSQSMDALLLAAMLAEPSEARLIVTHVSPVSRWVPEDMREEATDAIAERAREILVPARRATRELNAVEFRTLADDCVPRALNQLAEEEQADLLVLGSAHRAGLGRVMPGSVSGQLLNGVQCQVAVAPQGFHLGVFPPSLDAIGVAYDGSPESKHALELASELARQLHADLRVIRVLDPAKVIAALAYAYGIPPRASHLVEIRKSTYDEIAKIVSQSAVPTKSVILDGPEAKQLIDCSHEISLLVLGSRGYGPAQRVLIGSTSSKVVRSACCPVIVVPRGESPCAELSDTRVELAAIST